MTYLDELAAEIEHEIPAELLPAGDTGLLFRIYAVLLLAKGGEVTARDVHNAWAAWMQERSPHHRSVKPFSELDAGTQESDEPFAQAIRSVAGRRGLPVELPAGSIQSSPGGRKRSEISDTPVADPNRTVM
jgi:hypothetical protein